MNKGILRQISVVVAVIATVVLNVLANALPFNNTNTGVISDSFPLLFTPAGYVFAIWGVIYLGLIAFTIFQVLPSQRENPRLQATGWLFVWSCIANIVWLFCWHYGFRTSWFWLTQVAMLALLGLLISIYLRLGTGVTKVSRAETWAIRVPISIYLGWISVATIANTTIVLYSLGWTGEAIAPALTILLLLVGAALGLLMLIRHRDIAYALVLVWAYIGVGAPNKIADNSTVSLVAYLLAAALAVAVGVTLLRKPTASSSIPRSDSPASL
jgi:translocator protein